MWFEQLDEETVIITPNRRLAATLYKIYDAKQSQSCWIKPTILPLITWLQQLWHQLTTSSFDEYPQLLNSLQEDFLWETILTGCKESELLLQVNDVIELVKSAHQLLSQWLVDVNQAIFTTTQDYSALQHWLNRFQQRCEANNWISSATLPNKLIELIKQKLIKLPKQIILAGFTEVSPQFKQLFQASEQCGSFITHLNLTQAEGNSHRITLADEESEILTMARWAKGVHSQHKLATIGCIIPTLATKRDFIQQVFSTVFADDCFRMDAKSSPFNISAGKNLSQFPIIHAALQLISLYKADISIETLSYILSSPFLGNAESERIKRAKFDRLLRYKNINNINLSYLIDSADTQLSLTQKCPELANRLKQFYLLINKNNQLLSYSEWSQIFAELLSILGWPGERSLNSEEYQVVRSWLSTIENLISLDYIGQPVYFTQAVQTLHHVTAKQTFQAKSPDVPIQILGVLEAAAMPFDYVWIAGIDDINWPPQPKPNPFIPKSLQRELNMPHATAKRELLYCEELIKQFKQAAPNVIFSYAKNKANEAVNISPLIKNLAEITVENLTLADFQHPSERIYINKQVEYLNDEKGPIYQNNSLIPGGINIIKQQAACPFKAFAECRLHATELNTPQPGLRAIDRGSILHKTLELIWNKFNDQANLLAIDKETMKNHLDVCIDEALKSYRDLDHKHYYLQLEKQRLQKLMLQWLEFEKQRPPFKVIAKEHTATINLHTMQISIRIDRIDELQDGSKLVIDYKTSKQLNVNHWFSERPEEPQLPLYTLLDADKLTGITFAQIHPDDIHFKGISDYELDIAGIKSISAAKPQAGLNWNEQLAQWRTTFYKLSHDFCAGVATVDPKDKTKSCGYCTLKSFCRINEELYHG